MNSKKIADEKIIKAYEQHYSNLYRFCNAKLKNSITTDDCVQECFYILYKQYRKQADIVNVAGFLYKTADNLIKTQWRNEKRELYNVPLDEVEGIPFVENSEASNLDYDQMAKEIVEELSDSDYQLYRMKYVDKKKIKDIAEELDISFEATAKRLSRLREKVRDTVKSHIEGGE